MTTNLDSLTRELHCALTALRDMAKDCGAWGLRIEVVADGRVRADLFDSSGYSMIAGEAHGDVHAEVDRPLDLAAMVRLAREREARRKTREAR